jgi:hypothetical protein
MKILICVLEWIGDFVTCWLIVVRVFYFVRYCHFSAETVRLCCAVLCSNFVFV